MTPASVPATASWGDRVIAVILVVLGLSLAGYAIHLRGVTEPSSDVRTIKHGRTVSDVFTRRAGTDPLAIGLFGLAVVLVLGGAFYDRVHRISVGANTLELYPTATSPEERSALIAAVTTAVEERLARGPAPADAHDWVEIAVKTASAAASAQQQAEAYLAVVEAASPPVTDDHRAPLTRRGMPMSEELLEQLARQAVDATFSSGDVRAEAGAVEGAGGRGNE